MGKKSRREAGKARDIHAAIREHAAAFKAAPGPGVTDADDVPEVAALLAACHQSVAVSMPSVVVFEGRRYHVAARLAAVFWVFDSAGAAEPLLRGAAALGTFGHRPGH